MQRYHQWIPFSLSCPFSPSCLSCPSCPPLLRRREQTLDAAVALSTRPFVSPSTPNACHRPSQSTYWIRRRSEPRRGCRECVLHPASPRSCTRPGNAVATARRTRLAARNHHRCVRAAGRTYHIGDKVPAVPQICQLHRQLLKMPDVHRQWQPRLPYASTKHMLA